MSETRLYAVDRDGDVVIYERFQNAQGSAMAIWRTLAEKHLGATGMEFTMMVFQQGMKPLFDLAREGKLEPWETVTLMTTFDRVIIPIEHVASVASALEEFVKHYGPEQQERKFVFSIPAQAIALRKVVEEVEKEGWRGVCWNQMSVSESLWDGFPVTEKNDQGEEEDAGRQDYNVDKDTGHWFWPENKVDEADAEAVKEP